MPPSESSVHTNRRGWTEPELTDHVSKAHIDIILTATPSIDNHTMHQLGEASKDQGPLHGCKNQSTEAMGQGSVRGKANMFLYGIIGVLRTTRKETADQRILGYGRLR